MLKFADVTASHVLIDGTDIEWLAGLAYTLQVKVTQDSLLISITSRKVFHC